MAIDTQQKRASVFVLLPFLAPCFVVNAAIDAGDRAQVAWVYSGLFTPAGVGVTTTYPFDLYVATGRQVALSMRQPTITPAVTSVTSKSPNDMTQASSGVPWGFQDNAKVEDGSFARALVIGGSSSANLVALDYGFSIPAEAVVLGIVGTIKKYNGSGAGQVTDNQVILNLGSSNRALAGNWTSTLSYHTYGSSLDTWGLSLSPSDINATSFGFRISAILSTGSAFVDHMGMSVYYAIPNYETFDVRICKAVGVTNQITTGRTLNMNITQRRDADA